MRDTLDDSVLMFRSAVPHSTPTSAAEESEVKNLKEMLMSGPPTIRQRPTRLSPSVKKSLRGDLDAVHEIDTRCASRIDLCMECARRETLTRIGTDSDFAEVSRTM